jgi:hypothetical protein
MRNWKVPVSRPSTSSANRLDYAEPSGGWVWLDNSVISFFIGKIAPQRGAPASCRLRSASCGARIFLRDCASVGDSRFPGGTPGNAARMAALPAAKAIKYQRANLPRRRNSKPLVINPSRVNDEVTSGTAASP